MSETSSSGKTFLSEKDDVPLEDLIKEKENEIPDLGELNVAPRTSFLVPGFVLLALCGSGVLLAVLLG